VRSTTKACLLRTPAGSQESLREKPAMASGNVVVFSRWFLSTCYGNPVAAYRIVQEALTNVARHAHARACTVRLSIADAFQLEISDDGVGFPAASGAGVGLLSMRERAAESGGSCLVESAPGSGTRILVHLPLAKE
jgi:signal transduction histidine kinase